MHWIWNDARVIPGGLIPTAQIHTPKKKSEEEKAARKKGMWKRIWIYWYFMQYKAKLRSRDDISKIFCQLDKRIRWVAKKKVRWRDDNEEKKNLFTRHWGEVNWLVHSVKHETQDRWLNIPWLVCWRRQVRDFCRGCSFLCFNVWVKDPGPAQVRATWQPPAGRWQYKSR